VNSDGNIKKPFPSPTIKVDPAMEDFGSNPFFVKKLEDAKAFLKKAGLPKQLVHKPR
jgi:hypothetical protein